MWSFGTTMTMANDRAAPKRSDSQARPEAPSAGSSSAAGQLASQPSELLPETRAPIFSQRSLKQLSLFFAGAGFFALAQIITRRSIARKHIATIPKFYQPSNRPVSKISSDSSLIAMEALSLATLNVMGFGIMSTGGLMWAFDISNVDDLRRLARKHIGPGGGRTDEEAEREIEEWAAKVLMRKEQKVKEKEQARLPGSDDK